MAKTKNFNYFKAFIDMADCGHRAAIELKNLFDNESQIPELAEAIRTIESEADDLDDKIISEVNHSFITPIDREDVVNLADVLDNVVDSIEDVANQIDIFSINTIRPEANKVADLIVEATAALLEVATIFENYKNYKELNAGVKKLKALEEEGDVHYQKTMKDLMVNEKDAIELIKWKDIYRSMEEVLNCCDRAAKALRGAAIKNS